MSTNTTFKPGAKVIVTLPHPHFTNVPAEQFKATVITTTVHGRIVVALPLQTLTVNPNRVTAA